MALKIIHVMEFQIVFRTNLVLFISCIHIADTESNIWLEIMCAWFLLHCLVFKEHCLLAFNFLSYLHESAFI